MIRIACEPLVRPNRFRLLRPVTILGVPLEKGFEWNGASIPRVLWTIYGHTPFEPAFLVASAFHDKGYEMQGNWPAGSPESWSVRRWWDRGFGAILVVQGVPVGEAQAAVEALIQHGWAFWMDDEDRAAMQPRPEALDELSV